MLSRSRFFPLLFTTGLCSYYCVQSETSERFFLLRRYFVFTLYKLTQTLSIFKVSDFRELGFLFLRNRATNLIGSQPKSVKHFRNFIIASAKLPSLAQKLWRTFLRVKSGDLLRIYATGIR